jgi:hypothetical protein
MSACLQALLGGSIDYAGTFPPASLSLEQAARNYLWHRCQPESWLLARMICPVSQLDQLAELIDKELARAAPSSTASSPVRVSAILSGGATLDAWQESIAGELQAVRQCRESLHVEALEVRVPAEAAEQGGRAAFDALLDMLGAHEAAGPDLFLELPGELRHRWEATLERFVRSLAEYSNQPSADAPRKAGFKFRTGGTTSAAFISAEQLATVLGILRDYRVCWKATAGLHHALPYDDPALGVRMHGFVNVLAAAVMADAENLDRAGIRAILETNEPGAFQFSDITLSWRGVSVELVRIDRARRCSLLSFGTCSFDEPRDDLRALGWL